MSVAWFFKLKGVLLERRSRKREGDAFNPTKPRSHVTAGQALSAKDLREAELAIIQYCQQRRFREEIAALSSGQATVSRQMVSELNLIILNIDFVNSMKYGASSCTTLKAQIYSPL